MFCSKCGKEIENEAIICPHCGVPTQNFNQPRKQQVTKSQNNAFYQNISTARTLGLIATIGGIFSPLIGWICGGIGLSKSINLIGYYGSTNELEKAKSINIVGIGVATINFSVALFIIAMKYLA